MSCRPEPARTRDETAADLTLNRSGASFVASTSSTRLPTLTVSAGTILDRHFK